MGETAAPSDSEVDLVVLAKKPGKLLEKIFEASSQPRNPKGKGKEGTVQGVAVKKVTPLVAPGVVIQDEVRVEGVEMEWEVSEATPQGTRYTRYEPSTSRGRDLSVSRHGPKIERVGSGGSWIAHNPSYDDLPHAPRWNFVSAFMSIASVNPIRSKI
ncbi:hypothetical protein Hanom_Chr07g00621191 [Helianthus anomalus]